MSIEKSGKEEPSRSGSESERAPLESEQRDHAAEELITGDSDDAPLSEEAVAEMLRTASKPKDL